MSNTIKIAVSTAISFVLLSNPTSILIILTHVDKGAFSTTTTIATRDGPHLVIEVEVAFLAWSFLIFLDACGYYHARFL